MSKKRKSKKGNYPSSQAKKNGIFAPKKDSDQRFSQQKAANRASRVAVQNSRKK